MSGTVHLLNKLSSHIFWDVDKDGLDFDKHKKMIIQRVLEYGLIKDWNLIYTYYGIEEISKIAITLKDLDSRSISFISALSNIPKEEFICYTTKQSIPRHWNF